MRVSALSLSPPSNTTPAYFLVGVGGREGGGLCIFFPTFYFSILLPLCCFWASNKTTKNGREGDMAQEPLGQSAGGVQTAPDQYGRRKKIPNQIIKKQHSRKRPIPMIYNCPLQNWALEKKTQKLITQKWPVHIALLSLVPHLDRISTKNYYSSICITQSKRIESDSSQKKPFEWKPKPKPPKLFSLWTSGERYTLY